MKIYILTHFSPIFQTYTSLTFSEMEPGLRYGLKVG